MADPEYSRDGMEVLVERLIHAGVALKADDFAGGAVQVVDASV